MNDPWSTLRRGNRTLLRRQIEAEALHDGAIALKEGGPEAAAAVLSLYALPYTRVLQQQQMDEEADAC